MQQRIILFAMALTLYLTPTRAQDPEPAKDSQHTQVPLRSTSPPSPVTATRYMPPHLYFMASTGCSDSNPGTSISAPWCSAHHNVACGDVILAKPGLYKSGVFNNLSKGGTGGFGRVSHCPSTIGGIDGAGGQYFAQVLCAGAHLGDCTVEDHSNFAAIRVDNNNWAVQKFAVTAKTTSANQSIGYLADGTIGNASGGNVTHHICFINDIATDTGMGFATADGGTNNGSVPGNGVDQFCVIGSIAHDSNSWTQCIGAFDDAGPANFDHSPGTHVIFQGNFAINNQQKYGCRIADGEMFFFDTPDAHGYTGTMVMQDNLGFKSERMGLAVFYQNSVTSAALAHIRIVFNTIYGANNEVNGPTGGTYARGQINLSTSSAAPWPFPTTIQNNLSQDASAISAQGTALHALQVSVVNPNSKISIGGIGNENLLFGLATSCKLARCNLPRFDVAGDSAPWDANFFEAPNFKNASDAMNNKIGTPNCSLYETTVACMGWDWASQIAVPSSVIDDFTPQATHAYGKGYLPPQRACLTSGERYDNFPNYLKGAVGLHTASWTDNAVIYQKPGLINMPCGM